jgi:hypothetical protein
MNRCGITIFVMIFCLIVSGVGSVSGVAMATPKQEKEAASPCHEQAEKAEKQTPALHLCCGKGLLCKCCPAMAGVLPLPPKITIHATITPENTMLWTATLREADLADPPPRKI